MRIPLRPSPLVVVALGLMAGGVLASSRGAGDGPGVPTGGTEIAEGRALPGAPLPGPESSIVSGATGAPVLAADDFCRDAGYLCAELASQERVTLRRWVRHEGTLVVHVPLPPGEDPTTARALQQAVVQGIRVWNNQPFPILADLRGDRSPHFAVVWTPALGGSQIGVARTEWSEASGIRVLSVELRTRPPFGGAADPGQIRLTAAHEMGHALGLPHSDEPRDVMYPTNTATSMTARDYRSIEVLYSMPNASTVQRGAGGP